MDQSHASRKCYKCGESHNTSDCRHHVLELRTPRPQEHHVSYRPPFCQI